jgi:hypothetical protein
MSEEKTPRVLDEATRKELLGYLPFSTEVTIEWSPQEIPEAYRPTFILRSLTQAEMSQLRINGFAASHVAVTDEAIIQKADANVDLICNCVKGWRNFFDAGTGAEILYEESTYRDIVKRLPLWLSRSMLNYVKKISGLTAIEDLGLK